MAKTVFVFEEEDCEEEDCDCDDCEEEE